MACTPWNCGVPIVLLSILGILLPAPACRKSQKTAEQGTTQQAAVKEAEQRTFASPEEAGSALAAAASSGDRSVLIGIFGPDSKQMLLTDDEATDRDRLRNLALAYEQMHRWAKIKAGGEVLQVGSDNYPFPIPLGQNASGRWYFDVAAGKDEIQARGIGRNELKAMDACKAIADAERQYYAQSHDGGRTKQYAQQFVSDPGKHNGLYWPAAAGQTPSPLGDLDDFTKELSSTTETGKPVLFNGYHFRILTRGDTPTTRGFSILAYPAEYRQSGIMSFIADNTGAVYQKDLGEQTVEVAAAMAGFNLQDGWAATATRTGTATRMQQ
jgi:hypothetical protein